MKKISMLIAAIAVSFGSMATHTFFYDTYHTNNATMKVVVDTYVLNSCMDYTITVDGTYSIWNQGWGTSCGATEAMPEINSPGTTNGVVGFDFEYIFALNNNSHPLCGSLESQTDRMEISLDGGVTWFHPTPVVAAYDASHEYEYIVTGQGFPMQVRHISTLNLDDYGQLQFDIDEIAMDPCDFEPMFTSRQIDCSVEFTDASIFPCAGGLTILGVHYDFGDGTSSTTFNPTHSYAASGPYTVTYTVWVTNGTDCCKRTFEFDIEAEACDPCAEVIPRVDFSFIVSGLTIDFSETGISGLNPGDMVIGYLWDFGDGSTGTGTNPSHTYASSGSYTVTLTAFYFNDDTGECCSEQISYKVATVRSSSQDSGNITEMKPKEAIQLNVYPNPSTGVFTIAAKDNYLNSAQVFDYSGKVVHVINNNSEREINVDLTSLAPGYYVIIAESISGERYTSKIILE